MKYTKKTKILAILLCLSILFQCGMTGQAAPQTEENALSASDTADGLYYSDYISYDEYLSAQQEANAEVEPITVPMGSSGKEVQNIDGRECIAIAEGESLDISVDIPQSGYYQLQMDYYPVMDGTTAIKMELYIDGKIPFREAENISLKRIWEDADEKKYDSQGNQIRTSSEQAPVWRQEKVKDSTGFTEEPFSFYFAEGSHTITLHVYQNKLALQQITLTPVEEHKTYDEVLEEYSKKKLEAATQTYRIEAEEIAAKSDQSIITASDRTSPVTEPYSATTIVYNSIGGSNWKTVGEWIEWEVEAPEDGLYTIVMRYKQDTKSGAVSFRRLYIDGKVPFEEATSLMFPYDGSFKTVTLGNGKQDYQFYLEKGKHVLRMEVTLGSTSDIINRVSEAIDGLNDIYTDIVVITGPSPDTNRDYQFEKIIPETIEKIKVMSDELKQIEKELVQQAGKSGGENVSIVRQLYTRMDRMSEDPETISQRLSGFMSGITSLATWLNTSREQPLLLDYIMLSNEKEGTPKDKCSIFKTIKYHICQFLYSFKMDYVNIGNQKTETDKEITVWIASGRDQADILRKLVNESFIPENNIGVNVQLVNAGALQPATLAGEGPDVYLGMTQEQPAEYALRHAVADLSGFEDTDEVLGRFYEESLTSFYLDEGLYALPETMDYPMLFYRKDILSEMGIKEQSLYTWEGILQEVLPELDMNNLDFGLPNTLNIFGTFLYQNEGSFYTDDGTASMLNSEEAVNAFYTLTKMYTDYGIPLAYDFANRFRSGEMPLAVASFTSYNQLSVFAPEIEGRWGMLPIPGVENAEGTVNNVAMCSVTGASIMEKSENKEEAWTFLKWWTQSDTQAEYGRELETIMGTGARYNSANKEAMKSVEWERNVKEALQKQGNNLVGMPNVAGGYYTSRNYEFAFRDVVYDGKNLRESMDEMVKAITDEIINKRSEFYDKQENQNG